MTAFTWHTQAPTSGSLLADYILGEVNSVAKQPLGLSSQEKSELRTVVLFAVHKNLPNLELAIKVTPIYLDARREDFVREQQIHYLLTQIDAAAVRRAAHLSGAAAKPLFKTDRATPLAHEDTVSAAIVNTPEPNIVPLYDFVIQEFDLSMIGSIAGRQKLADIMWIRPHQAAFTVQRRLRGVLPDLITTDKNGGAIVRRLHFAILQICAMLHSLLAIGFTHGDTHPRNIGYAVASAVDRHYELARGVFFRIPADAPHIMLLDFDASRAEMTDATGKNFQMIPSMASLNARFRGVVAITPAQTFSPMVDVFRLVHSVLLITASRMLDDSVAWGPAIVQTDDFTQFARTCKAGIGQLPPAITALPSYTALATFVDELLDQKWERIKTAANTLNNDVSQTTLWYEVYAATPATKTETAGFLLPWDVLKTYPIHGAPESATSVDMTLAPIYGRGKVYRPWDNVAPDDATRRVHPLTVAFKDEMKR